MNETYLTLLRELSHATELIAEHVLNFNKTNKDENGAKSAEIMRDDYAKLYDRLREKDFNPATLDRADYAKFLVGAFIVSQNIENRIKTEKTALNGYKIDLIPKLERIVNEASTDEEAKNLAKEIFQINT